MTDMTPRLPENWREFVAQARSEGIPDSPTHQFAYRNFVAQCFPGVETTNPHVQEQLEAWWVLTQLRHDVWRYWLTAPTPDEHAS